jgi:hypothetical protein
MRGERVFFGETLIKGSIYEREEERMSAEIPGRVWNAY